MDKNRAYSDYSGNPNCEHEYIRTSEGFGGARWETCTKCGKQSNYEEGAHPDSLIAGNRAMHKAYDRKKNESVPKTDQKWSIENKEIVKLKYRGQPCPNCRGNELVRVSDPEDAPQSYDTRYIKKYVLCTKCMNYALYETPNSFYL